nr:MAG TPA: hypothetical protein [Caudoviricetes sp.]
MVVLRASGRFIGFPPRLFPLNNSNPRLRSKDRGRGLSYLSKVTWCGIRRSAS